MKLFFVTLCFLVSCSILTFAQSRFKPGYVVSLQNDTLKGFVDYRGWDQNPQAILFKNTVAEEGVKTYTVSSASAFGVTNLEDYQKFTVNVSTANTAINFLPVKPDTSYQQATVFLKLVTAGAKINLYSFTDNIKTRYYALDKNTRQVKELAYYLYYLSDDRQQTQSLNLFRNQLKEFALLYQPGNSVLISKIEYAKYNETALTDIADRINGGQQQQKRRATSGVRFFAGAFYRRSTLRTDGNTLFPPGTKGKSNSPGVAVGLDLLWNKVTQKAYFRIELGYIQSHYYIPPTLVNALGLMASIDFKQYTISATPQFIYNFYSTDKFKIFLNGGLTFNYSNYNKYYYNQAYSGTNTRNENYPDFNKFWTEAPVKLGCQLNKRLEIYGVYSTYFNVSSYNTFSASTSYYQAGINYLFN